jgi:uroporphyrinogen decarboxylase
MTPRDRVLAALNFTETPLTPLDLGAMRSTGISAFAYPRLVEALGLPPRRPRVHDTGQMLALPDLDVLDALGCDVVTIDGGVTDAYDEPEKWHDYDFGGRLPARVLNPDAFVVEADGVIRQWGSSIMPPSSFVFNSDHSGQPLLGLDAPLPLMDLAEHRRRMVGYRVTDEQVKAVAEMARRVRSSTDRAVFMTDWCGSGLGIGGHSGIGIFPMICKLEPDYVREYHEIQIENAIYNVRAVLPAVAEYVDIVMTTADDWGTQKTLIASPATYRDLFLPYYRRLNDEVHALLPNVKTFMHNCGAIYDILDMIVESGFDILNPIQWPAGGHGYREWKDKLRGRATMWGGGVDTQHTLAQGTRADVLGEIAEIVPYCCTDGGFVFNNVHNLLAEVDAETVVAMYRAARDVRR